MYIRKVTMNIFLLFTILFTGLLITLIGIIIYKITTKKELPDSHYTPFDYITAQTAVEFHEEKEEKEQEDEQGDDKDKNEEKK
ncbi:hypothetical protein HMPREF0083_05203 [Aneurinibacillus aneurinilyticus ATCC 12856]|uniref:DUF3951 domain-containing protein n=2 Tax=Aneurinibacillus aneurinilyticus TaxID=1391 RepID=U1Y3G8_ANEAE|nr:hypothetical protein HMPREF0083_05203 [Aneurinibacillus aneurinilyticus ATCC 12856]